ncbi:RNA polymerase sigma factor [Loigolactobacillus iwatensis]|uniref:RNA polymerase sigma factor n=1 Tax=Loigolactobacillus iwatensis TaxID=1267156 RepID=UPI0013DDEDCC|nr:sigma-70 family RNA polymerase sigma factor [Loigolactobacillus iwatensis]
MTSLDDVIRVAASGNSDALEWLFKKYLPLLKSLQHRYYLRLYDYDDWCQEARLICYHSAQQYDHNSHLSFGRFYQMQLQHHIINLIRRQLAQKRQVDRLQIPVEQVDLENAYLKKSLLRPLPSDWATINCDLIQYWQSLSKFEQRVMLLVLESTEIPAIAKQIACTESQVNCAIARCRTKLRRYLYQGSS